jgi:phosphate butyryltransferase
MEAVCRAAKDGFISPILIGDQNRIEAILSLLPEKLPFAEIINEADERRAARTGAMLARDGNANFILKGKLDTEVLLKAVVDPESALRAGTLMSHLAFLEIPGYHKLVVLTDSGMVVEPNLEQKKKILQNAVNVLHSMGYESPKVGVLAAVEKVNPKMLVTVEAEALTKMNRAGDISGCYVEGPISYDILMDSHIAKKKEYESPVVGDADILLAGDMTAGNILGKALTVSAKAKMAGIVVGAKVPVALTSRGAEADEKYNSLLLAAASCS